MYITKNEDHVSLNKEHTRWGKNAFIALLAIIGIVLHLVFLYIISGFEDYALYPLLVVLIVGGGSLVYDLLIKLIHFDFGSDLLAGMSIVTSVFLDQYLAGSLVVLMLAGGETLEEYAIKTASKVLDALAKRAPTIAHRKKNGSIQDIAANEIAIGDKLVIFPHEICPVDGIVIEGNGVMDESYLTGEPFLIAKAPGSFVISGSVNGERAIEIESTKRAQDSRYAKIMRVMSDSEDKKPKLRRLADQLGAWYTPVAVVIALIAWFTSGDPIRFLAVLVIATPCPLLIAIPVAIIGSISLSAKQGILIKNPLVLEQANLCKTMIFDKTGTLTYGKPLLTDQHLYNGFSADRVLQLVASMEKYSKHPLATAIMERADSEKLSLFDAEQISEPQGKGLSGVVDGHVIVITSRKLLPSFSLISKPEALPEGNGLECVVLIDNQLAAHYRFRDTPRKDSKHFVDHLFPMHGINRVMIISGDREDEVKYLAEVVGIAEIHAGQSPEQKVAIVMEETKKAKTLYLGDGINDAPALMVSTVGVAFGRNSDVTAESAGVVVLEDTLEKVDEFLHISQRMRTIALQSAWGGMILSCVGMVLAAMGYLPPVAGAISQEIIDVVAILNSLRTLWKPRIISDF